jgi:DNA-binding transcriptional ArsR family regulator
MPRSQLTPARLAHVAPVFTALSNETRLYIVSRLCREGPLSISRLAEGTALSRQAVTKHLEVLSKAGIARSGRSGREQLWQVQAQRLSEVRRLLVQISAQWDEALGRLSSFVEGRAR